VYDVEMRKITLRLKGHTDDINAVCFADPLSTNVLFSGSDDSVVKVWDRRSMAGGRESGCLPGHMEGITFVASKGDGRYVISNGKDQTLKLWDIRKMMERSDFDALPRKDFCCGFDYRWMVIPHYSLTLFGSGWLIGVLRNIQDQIIRDIRMIVV
jgi:DDB1- and CUL4-associated factor 11